MAKDSKGQDLQVGDYVRFTARVTHVHSNEDWTTAQFQILDFNDRGLHAPNFTAHTALAEKIETPDALDADGAEAVDAVVVDGAKIHDDPYLDSPA